MTATAIEPLESTVLVRADDNPIARQILEAAVSIISARGYHGTSVRDIASRAEVSAGTLYNYFGSKQELLVTIMCRAMDMLIARSQQALEEADPDPISQLNALVAAHVRVHAWSGRESLIGNSELRSLDHAHLQHVIEKRNTQQALFDEVIARGREQGLFLIDSVKLASHYIVTACTAVATWYRPQGPVDAEGLIRHYQALSRQLVGQHGSSS